MIETINVIEVNGGCIMHLVSFLNDIKGNNQAKELFAKIISDNYPETSEFEMNNHIHYGRFEDDDYEVILYISDNS